MKKHEEAEKDNSERWMLTYLDMITLLMVFFVLLFAMSNVDSKKYTSLAKSLNSAMGGGTGFVVGEGSGSAVNLDGSGGNESSNANVQAGQLQANENNLESLKKDVESYLKKENMSDYVIVQTDERGLDIRLKDSVLFDSGKADIKGDARDTLVKIGKIISKVNGYVRVEGHTDNVPIKNNIYKSNWQLSAMRATNVVELLISNSGIASDKISAVGYGEFRPIVDNNSAANRAKNRRVEIVLMNSKYNSTESNKN